MRLLTFTTFLLLSACDRTGLEEPPIPDAVPGTFDATVRQIGGAGFENMAGPAVFSETEAGGFIVRLVSRGASSPDTTTLTLVAGRGTTPLNEGTGLAALCYRSPVFQDGPYRAESGVLTVTQIDQNAVEGALDGIAFLDLPTGPNTTIRIRVRIEGSFRALRGLTGLDGDSVRSCELD